MNIEDWISRTNPHVFAHSVQENCGPLSENTCSGIPCLARIPFIFMMMNDAWVEYVTAVVILSMLCQDFDDFWKQFLLFCGYQTSLS